MEVTDAWTAELAGHPRAVSAASQLLASTRLRVFTTRILCKLPGESIEVPWHQDSAYWPLEPVKVTNNMYYV